MKNITRWAQFAVVTFVISSVLVGCGGSEIDDVPDTPAEKIKAIENNPDYTPEQKATFKKQVEDNERMKALLEKRGRELDPGKPQPMPSR